MVLSKTDMNKIAARNRDFENDDLSWMTKMAPPGTTKDEILLMFHQTRLECTDISREKRKYSQRWLVHRKFPRLGGRPLTGRNSLPKAKL